MSLIVDGIPVQSNDTISLSSNQTYKFVCTAINAKPDVDLSLYDSNSLLPLSNGANNKSTGFCDANNLCSKILQVDFQFVDPRFNNMSSLTCQANSNNPQVNLTTSIQRNVEIKSQAPVSLTTNAKLVVGDAFSAFSISCNTSGLSPNQTIVWVQTINETGIYLVEEDNRTSILNNGGTLSFSRLLLIDEEYYGCGTFDSSTKKLKLINSYYLFIRGNVEIKANLSWVFI